MRVFTQEQCQEIVAEFDATQHKHDESNEAYYANSVGVGDLPTTLKHVERITRFLQQRYPNIVFSNTYTRQYNKGSVLRLHTDRVGLDLTLSICLEKSTPKAWPLKVSRVKWSETGAEDWDLGAPLAPFVSEYDSYDMVEGVGAVCEGRKYPHWRDPLDCAEDERAVYVFYHWTQKAVAPFVPVVAMNNPVLALYDNFLSDEECDQLIRMAQGRLERSTVVHDKTGQSVVNDHRTSSGMSFRRQENPLIAEIERRISALTGFPVENGEGIQILRYGVGEEYRPHYDYFDPNHPALARDVENNRVLTVLLYLNTPEAGGSTTLPDANIGIAARKGGALMFAYPTPNPESKTLHSGDPVRRGEKWVATKWIRRKAY